MTRIPAAQREPLAIAVALQPNPPVAVARVVTQGLRKCGSSLHPPRPQAVTASSAAAKRCITSREKKKRSFRVSPSQLQGVGGPVFPESSPAPQLWLIAALSPLSSVWG